MALRMVFVGGLVVPVQLIILPLFIILREINLLGDMKSLIIIYSAFGIPSAVLILTGFFAALPRDLEDAARIDGVGKMGMRRLTRKEYDATLADLLADETQSGFKSLPEDVRDPFDNDFNWREQR